MTTTTLLAQELSTLNWSVARLILIAHFLIGVIKLRTVNLVRLAGVFDTEVEVDSNYKRLQRLFRHFELDFDAIARLIYRWLPSGKWILGLDRTNWQIGTTSVNILVLAVAYRGIAIPLIWACLNKKGNSNTKERITLLERFIKLFGKERIAYLTADREFRGHDWLRFLVSEQIPFRVRIPNNTRVPNRHRNQTVPVTRLFRLRVNEVMVLSKCPKSISRFLCSCYTSNVSHHNLRKPDLSSETWESHARVVCEHLNEKHRRWVVGLLAEVIGWGGTQQIAQATGIDPKTIRQGRLDLQQGIEGYPVDRVRRAGGGRPPLKKKRHT